MLGPSKDDTVAKRKMENLINSKRTEKLINLKKREQLKDLLIRKFRQKYPMADIGKIAAEVGKIVSGATVNEEDLSNLERNIRKLALGYSRTTSTLPPQARKNNEKQKSSKLPHVLINDPAATDINTSSLTGANGDIDPMIYEQYGTPRSYSSSKFCKATWDDDWSRISTHNKLEFDVFEKEKTKGKLVERKKWTSALDQSITMQKRAKEEEKKLKLKYKHDIESKTKEWKTEEENKQRVIRNAALKIKKERAIQLKQIREIKKKQAEQEKLHDVMMAQRVKDAADDDTRKEKEKLIDQKRRLKAFLLQNEEGKLIKEKQKEELMDEEAKILRQSEEKAIARERQRAFEESERQRKMKERIKVVEHSDVMQLAREQEKQDIKRMLLEQEKHEIEETRKASEKLRKRKEADREQVRILKEQVDEKLKLKIAKRKENFKQAAIFKKEAEKAIKEENDKEMRRKLLAIENQKELQRQMNSKVVRKLNPINLSDTERKLNTGLLNQVNLSEVQAPRNLRPW